MGGGVPTFTVARQPVLVERMGEYVQRGLLMAGSFRSAAPPILKNEQPT
jgi:hypothetical protein